MGSVQRQTVGSYSMYVYRHMAITYNLCTFHFDLDPNSSCMCIVVTPRTAGCDKAVLCSGHLALGSCILTAIGCVCSGYQQIVVMYSSGKVFTRLISWLCHDEG